MTKPSEYMKRASGIALKCVFDDLDVLKCFLNCFLDCTVTGVGSVLVMKVELDTYIFDVVCNTDENKAISVIVQLADGAMFLQRALFYVARTIALRQGESSNQRENNYTASGAGLAHNLVLPQEWTPWKTYFIGIYTFSYANLVPRALRDRYLIRSSMKADGAACLPPSERYTVSLNDQIRMIYVSLPIFVEWLGKGIHVTDDLHRILWMLSFVGGSENDTVDSFPPWCEQRLFARILELVRLDKG